MTKKLFLTLVSVVFLVFSLTGCGDKKDDTTDTGDTAADTDNTDTGDTATTPDEDTTDTGDTATTPDEDTTDTGDTATDTDEDNTDTGTVTQDGCTIKSSFGTHSAKRELSQTCIHKITEAKSATCTWDYKNEEETSKHIEYLQKIEITFGNECKEQDKTVECPDFIPESLKFINLSGCDVYSADPDTDCEVQCADLYFQTDDDVFHTVYVGATGAEVGNEAFIRSSDVITEASFSSTLKVGSNNAVFRWYEKVEDGTEIEKTASVEMTVVNPNAEEEPVPDTDTVPDEDIEVVDE